MAERNLLCIEPDAATVAEIRSALEPYGFGIENIPNGDDAIEWGRSHPTSLIILSVEPRKIGYAICNKLKKSPSLREVPLILISAEETQATFEQHRKLKAHADEYLLKPLNIDELMRKVDKLVRLGERQDADEIHEADSGDIIISDEDMADELALETGGGPAAAVTPGLEAGLALSEDAMRSDTSEQPVISDGQVLPFQGEAFDSETQAAFAALEAGSAEGGTTSPGVSGGDLVDLRSLWSDEDLPPQLAWETPPKTGPATPPPDGYRSGSTLGPEAVPPPPDPVPGPGPNLTIAPDVVDPLAPIRGEIGGPPVEVQADVPPSPDEIEYDDSTLDGDGRSGAHDLAFAPSDLAPGVPDIAPLPVRDDGRVRELESRAAELQARIESLEAERQTMRKELDEARERFTQSATFSKEREFLALREIINKKEKDILDLRDGMDAKERQVLDHKDKIRELERARRDLEESTLGFERNMVAANEKVAELTGDREKSGEREKALKSRLDVAHEENRKAHEEVEALRKRLALEEMRGRSELDKLRTDLESRLAEAEDTHRQELTRLKDEQAAAVGGVEIARQSELARMDATHKSEVEALQRRLTDEQAVAAERLVSEVARLRRDHEKAIASSKEEQGTQLAAERQAYEALTETKERDHRNEILAVRRRHEEELTAAEERRQRDIAEQEGRRVSELEAAEARRRAELQGRDEEQHARITEIERRHLTEKTELSERHRADYDQALGRAARSEGELAARVQEVEQAYRRVSGLEADLDATRAELGERGVRLAQSRDRIAELEAKVADYEDQIVRAYQRLRNDEKTTEKARRALAVALALIDERAAVPGAVMKTPSGPTTEESELKT
jgi:DNA-binding response OmpR family regulator